MEDKMSLFTVIMEFNEGTFVSQIRDTSPAKSLIKWAKKLDIDDIPGLGPKLKEQLLNSFNDTEHAPVLLDGMKNVWCTCVTLTGKLLLVHIIKTE